MYSNERVNLIDYIRLDNEAITSHGIESYCTDDNFMEIIIRVFHNLNFGFTEMFGFFNKHFLSVRQCVLPTISTSNFNPCINENFKKSKR